MNIHNYNYYRNIHIIIIIYVHTEILATVDREIFVLKIFRALKFHGAKFS